MHGPPERSGLDLLESARNNPIPGWDVEPGNELAIAAGVRYVELDPSWAFPGDPDGSTYEHRRPHEIRQLAKNYKRALEVHDRPDETGEYVTVSSLWRHDVLRMAAALSIHSVIIDNTLPTLAAYEDALIVDLCRGDGTPEYEANIARNVERLRACMTATTMGTLPRISTAGFNFFTFVVDIHNSVEQELNLNDGDTVRPFEPLPDRAVRLLNLPVDKEYFVQCWNYINSSKLIDGGSRREYFGTVLQRTTLPEPLGAISRQAIAADLRSSDPVTARRLWKE